MFKDGRERLTMTERLSTGETLLFQSARWIAMGLVLILLLGIGVLGFQVLDSHR